MKNNTVSVCCKAPVILRGNTTRSWECAKCDKPCDAYTLPNVSYAPPNPPTETVSDYKNKEVSMSKTTMLDPKRGWIPAIEEPYYPSLLEKIKHFLGIHCWTLNTPPCGNPPRMCLICHKKETI